MLRRISLFALLLLLACEAALFVEEPLTFTLAPVFGQQWEGLLGLTDTATVDVTLLDSEGRPSWGPELTWQATEPSIVEIVPLLDSLTLTYRARLRGLSEGSTQVSVGLADDRLVSPPLSFRVEVVPLAVDAGGTWPDTMDAAELAVVSAKLIGPAGSPVLTGEVVWKSSDPTVVSVISQPAGVDSTGTSYALLAGQANGQATITASVDVGGGGDVHSEDILVLRQTLPDSVSVGEEVTARLVAPASLSLLGGIDWGSVDPSVLRADSASLLGRTRGRTSLTASISSVIDGLGHTFGPLELRLPLSVVPVRLELRQGLIDREVKRLGSPVVLEVQTFGANGDSIVVPVQWRSGNTSVVEIVDTSVVRTATVEGRTLGSTDIQIITGGGELEAVETPVALQVVERWRSVSVGPSHACALAWDGRPYCWGTNSESGALGDGSMTNRADPVRVSGGYSFDEIQVGGYPHGVVNEQHTCAMVARNLFCWGSPAYGQLGSGANNCTALDFPCGRLVPLYIQSADAFAVGGLMTCTFWQPNQSSRCWGSFEPSGDKGVFVTDSEHGAGMRPGGTHVCFGAPEHSANIACAGRNERGQLGDGSTLTVRASLGIPPSYQPLPDSLKVRTASGEFLEGEYPPGTFFGYNSAWLLALGDAHACAYARTASSTTPDIWCWGNDSGGQLGPQGDRDVCDGFFRPYFGAAPCSRVAVPVGYPGMPILITAGASHTCVLDSTLEAYCWGDNTSGQLGINGVPTSASPVRAAPALTFASLSAGGDQTCGVDPTGNLYCWGVPFLGGQSDASPRRIFATPGGG